MTRRNNGTTKETLYPKGEKDTSILFVYPVGAIDSYAHFSFSKVVMLIAWFSWEMTRCYSHDWPSSCGHLEQSEHPAKDKEKSCSDQHKTITTILIYTIWIAFGHFVLSVQRSVKITY